MSNQGAAAAPDGHGPVHQRLALLSDRLRVAEPERTAAGRHRWEAATALVLAPGDDDVEVAIIERSERPGDRWSGQLALPGGRRDDVDPDLATTAAREAAEEVGLELGPATALVTEHRARIRPGVVACYAFTLTHRPALRPEPAEVATAWWVPLSVLTDPANATTTRHTGVRFPAIDIDGRPLWGMTLMTLERFASTAGLTLATR
ncbi:MAG: NUDIX hydrolase [Nitriliruptoraceae bacterium]